MGASSGLLTIWIGNLFDGTIACDNSYSITVKFKSLLSDQTFYVSNIYGPSSPAEKASFVNWLYNVDASSYEDWLLVGDFNFIRVSENRNKLGGSANDMMLFNDLIQHMDLVDIPFHGAQFTWSNMQDDPLLENLDWVFTSTSWNFTFPATKVQALSQLVYDHIPCKVAVGTSIPKSSQFRFENYWAEFNGFFFDTMALHWHNNPFFANMARTISNIFKQLGKGLKEWSREFSKLGKLINNWIWVIAMLDGLEGQRPLSRVEANFRLAVKKHLLDLLEAKRIYWKQRAMNR